MSPAEFEPAFTASEWPQTHALDCATTGIRQLGWSYHTELDGRNMQHARKYITSLNIEVQGLIDLFTYLTKIRKFVHPTALL